MSDITRSSAEQLLGELGSAVSKNPAPAALVGMGLFWLLTSKRSDYALPAAFRASSEAARPGREGSKPDHQATNPGNSAGGSYLAIIRSELSDLMQRQPLVIGAIGLAIGAGLAASIPMSETETAFLGDASASLQNKARSVGIEQSRRARSLANDVAAAIEQETRDQGLASDDVKRAADDTREKLQRVIHTGVDGVRERLK
jgi:hypothetical protein